MILTTLPLALPANSSSAISNDNFVVKVKPKYL
jgi:hypothetical protein